MPTFTLVTEINAPIERCFDLARSVDLHTQSSEVPERAVAGKTSRLLEFGDEVTWEGRHFGTRQRLSSRISQMDRPNSFSVEMVKGAFASHTHHFEFAATDGGTTLMREAFSFRSPFGLLGRAVDYLVMTRYLKRFILHRNRFLKETAERGGGGVEAPAPQLRVRTR